MSSATEVLLQERAALCDTFEKYGPTRRRCARAGSTLDLAAHLVAREARSDAAIGLVCPPLAEHLQKVMDRYKARGYEPLVAMLRTGPPWMHRTGPLATANVNENFIHHEDVRRAVGRSAPRASTTEMDAILWKMLGFGARMSKKAVKGAALTLRTPDGRERVVSTDRRPVTMTGSARRDRACSCRDARRRPTSSLEGDADRGRDRARGRPSASELGRRLRGTRNPSQYVKRSTRDEAEPLVDGPAEVARDRASRVSTRSTAAAAAVSATP